MCERGRARIELLIIAHTEAPPVGRSVCVEGALEVQLHSVSCRGRKCVGNPPGLLRYTQPGLVSTPTTTTPAAAHNSEKYLFATTQQDQAGFTGDSRAGPSPVCRSRFANPEHVRSAPWRKGNRQPIQNKPNLGSVCGSRKKQTTRGKQKQDKQLVTVCGQCQKCRKWVVFLKRKKRYRKQMKQW